MFVSQKSYMIWMIIEVIVWVNILWWARIQRWRREVSTVGGPRTTLGRCPPVKGHMIVLCLEKARCLLAARARLGLHEADDVLRKRHNLCWVCRHDPQSHLSTSPFLITRAVKGVISAQIISAQIISAQIIILIDVQWSQFFHFRRKHSQQVGVSIDHSSVTLIAQQPCPTSFMDTTTPLTCFFWVVAYLLLIPFWPYKKF